MPPALPPTRFSWVFAEPGRASWAWWGAFWFLSSSMSLRPPTHPLGLALPSAGSAGQESSCNMGHLGLIPGLRQSPGEGNGYPLQYSGLENSMDCIVHVYSPWGCKESDTTAQLSISLSILPSHPFSCAEHLPDACLHHLHQKECHGGRLGF